MIHLGKNTTSRIISKGIAAGHSQNTYRGLVSSHRKAKGARNFTNCDSLLIGNKCGAHTVPYIEAKNSSTVFEHEATTSKISEDMLFYCRQRGLTAEEATALVVNGFVKDVLQQLPMEFAVEAQKLISVSLEGSVGLVEPDNLMSITCAPFAERRKWPMDADDERRDDRHPSASRWRVRAR